MKADYIQHMGTDLTVVNAARVSFDKESEWDIPEDAKRMGYSVSLKLHQKDVKLINYLASHGHWTPFSHTSITMRETVPIFVARQRFKHMVGFTYNEVSRRYVDDTPEFFTPDVWRSRPEGSVKQGSGGNNITSLSWEVDKETIDGWTRSEMGFDLTNNAYQTFIKYAEWLYQTMIDNNVAPEQARMVLPQSMYTSYYVTGSLYAWARAYNLRIDPHSQYEIQCLAKEWDKIIKPLFPVSWSALTQQ